MPYCGSNPISDMWSEKAMSLLASAFRRAVHHGDDTAARHEMAMAATFAGLGFGNAGVHIPHANAYPIAGRVKDFSPEGYPDEPMVPHGMAVSLTAPEAFRWTFEASPERHLKAATLLAPDHSYDKGPDALANVLTDLMQDITIPNGLGAVGYDEGDVDDLVEGTMKQQRPLRHRSARGDRGRRGARSSRARSSCGEHPSKPRALSAALPPPTLPRGPG